MPSRKDQVPKDAIGPDNPLELNHLLAELGQVFNDDVMRLFFLALNQPEDAQEMAGLLDYVAWVVEHRDVSAFKRMAEAFEFVVDRLKPGASQDVSRLQHAIEYELEARSRGEQTSAAGLVDYLISKGAVLEMDEAYARRIRRRLGTARSSGRPRKKAQ